MATIMEAPISPMSAHAFPTVHEAASKMDMTHLSGATMADLIMEPKIHLVTASPSASKRSSSSMVNSKRSSYASTTKSTLRHSNQLLIEMLQNIQTELSAHRSIMLDIQHRVSHLEHESNASVNNDPPQAALLALEGQRDASRRTSKLIPPEGQTWWQACQNFARNSEPPISAAEFLRTPKRFSGIDWQYGAPSAKPNTPPATPPEVDDLPPLTPTSEGSELSDRSDLDTPTQHYAEFDEDEIEASTPKIPKPETPLVDEIETTPLQVEDDIKEHTVEIDKKKMPMPPVLQPPPSGKPISVNSQEVITAIAPEPIMPAGNPHRYYKGVRSLATYKALMRNKATDKDHYVLIHFHKRADLKDLEADA